ncbi:multidrug transporter [Thermococcus sp. MV11]|uniref:multidrug transporter n=1 Tax=Thermococcus sp. MV11 TaxID=1638267 RepID=UPI001F0ECA84|nr:multidrug transporter [Thermococcus sp. MV11]
MVGMKGHLMLALLLVAALVIGLAVNVEAFLSDYSHQEGYFGADSLQAELLPADSHVLGTITADNPFSVYVVVSDSGYFEGLERGRVVMKWENITKLNLNITVPDDGYYLVVKNGNVSQEIRIDLSSGR